MNSNHSNNPSTPGYEVNDIYGHSKVNMICFMDVPLLESTVIYKTKNKFYPS